LDTHENTHANPPPPIKLLPLLPPHAQPIILSLSGGVDSMVCSYILAKQNTRFQAVHINYGNRATADAEEAFVRDWCAYLGIPLYVRRITEIKREPCMNHNMRDIYETYTRRVRLGTYDTISPASTIIVLGHNKDDCLENIMTNIAGRTHFDNLTGMSHEKFYRPLLHVSKADIKAFAAHHGVPHLPNSTPPWSQRGQIRASIVPVLDAWNPLFVPGMHHLSTMLAQYHQLARHLARLFIAQPSMDMVVNNTCFWRAVFDILTPIHHPSLKSIDNLITTVNTKTPPYTVIISKHLTMKVDKAGRIVTHLA
jgi:tRNA(Ile)-lysidine synthetase-like protein